MSAYENGLYNYIEGRLLPLERAGKCYFFRNNSFSGRIQRPNGSSGYIKNNKKGTPDVVACFAKEKYLGTDSAILQPQEFVFYRLGQFVGFEIKTPTGKQSQTQKDAQKIIESAGGLYYVVHTVEEFEEVLKGLV